MTFAEAINPMIYPNKKNIFFASQGVIGDLTTQAIPVHRGWVKIPKGKQRFGLGDRFAMTVAATGAEIEFCGMSTYKEYD